jgi:hypothetical protein
VERRERGTYERVVDEFELKHYSSRLLLTIWAVNRSVTAPACPLPRLSIGAARSRDADAVQREREWSDFLVLRVEVSVVERFQRVLERVNLVLLQDVGKAFVAEEVARWDAEDEAGVLREQE